MAYVTVERAKSHLNIDHDSDDTLLQSMILQGSAIVADYLKIGEDVYDVLGSPSGVPYVIEAATLLVIGSLYENRDGSEDAPQPLSQAVKDLLHRQRDPAIA